MSEIKKESGTLKFLYSNAFGRFCLKLLASRWLSKAVGAFLSSSLSKPLIKSFVKNNGINLSEFKSDNFTCFNDCFCREIREGKREIQGDENTLISPCDGLLSAYKISTDTVLPVKQSRYTINSLLQNKELAESFNDGLCLVFRLCVNHYHRYCYPFTGIKGKNVFIKGKLHTVRPIALESYPVFTENCREYTVMESELFGKAVQIEVGAMLVGKIKNHHGAGKIIKGAEKGMFLYGGSTIILLLEKDNIDIAATFFENTEKGIETPVKMGEILGARSAVRV